MGNDTLHNDCLAASIAALKDDDDFSRLEAGEEVKFVQSRRDIGRGRMRKGRGDTYNLPMAMDCTG
jgi:hypothetical protein